MKKIGIMTGGADCPGLNSVIRSVVRKGMQEGYVVTGIKNGWQGLIENDMRVLDVKSTSGILDKGGTILGTSRVNPLADEDHVKKIKENYARSGMDALIVVGGEETIKIALQLHKRNIIQAVAVPKSIDNALSGTDYAFGFDTAVNVATECIDRLHTTAESHHRIMVVEVLGLYTGWLAVQAGIAGGADIILIPEIPVNLKQVYELLNERHKRGKPFSIVVISEGTKIDGYVARPSPEMAPLTEKRRFGSVGEFLAKAIEDNTGYETRVSVLGYILRGGSPTAFDRVLGTRLGVKAVDLVKEHKFGKMASLKDNKIRYVDMEEAVFQRKLVTADLVEIADVFSARQ
ncbi:MAG: 6-phosphofructokinase [Candidatus Omnitrophica bacterium]|nr:6-phosphofructokinase [Candidatus Omnitrophota bacterium]MDE2222653.1 6-phosphofructokinase [Candidatus Omnitrophota bacterium]